LARIFSEIKAGSKVLKSKKTIAFNYRCHQGNKFSARGFQSCTSTFLIMGVGLSAMFFASNVVATTNQQLGVALAGAAGLLFIALRFAKSEKGKG